MTRYLPGILPQMMVAFVATGILSLYGAVGFTVGIGKIEIMTFFLHPFVSVVVCYAFVLAGATLENLISRLLYKKELSKFAFGSALRQAK